MFFKVKRFPTVNENLLLCGQTLRSQFFKLREPEGKLITMTGELVQELTRF